MFVRPHQLECRPSFSLSFQFWLSSSACLGWRIVESCAKWQSLVCSLPLGCSRSHGNTGGRAPTSACPASAISRSRDGCGVLDGMVGPTVRVSGGRRDMPRRAIACSNGEVVQCGVALDCHDREALGQVAVPHDCRATEIQQLMQRKYAEASTVLLYSTGVRLFFMLHRVMLY